MQKIKYFLLQLITVFTRLCWAGTTYSVIGMLLSIFEFGNYKDSIKIYVIGIIICLLWLILIPFMEVYLKEDNF